MRFFDILTHCMNPKIIAVLGGIVLVVIIFAPSQSLRARFVPFLFVLICPLSMVVIMRTMHRSPTQQSKENRPQVYEKDNSRY